ncbi:MAG TPA: hypothetical protein VK176_02195 [Phycisphaerales bacterium]|nr:hypothetical protein [Phycisphaerales bacterium]
MNRIWMKRICAAGAATALLCTTHGGVLHAGVIAEGRALLRGRDAGFVAGVVLVDGAGVHTSTNGSDERVIPWHRVAKVEGPLAGEASGYLLQGEELWRALARLDRGDLPSAEVLLEGLDDGLASTPGPTAEAIWMGLMRCRLERGAQTGAAAAWLMWRSVRPQDQPVESTPGEASDRTPASGGLVPAIPPVWVNVPSVAVLASGGMESWKLGSLHTGEVVSELSAWYLRAAQGACDREAAGWPEVSADADVMLVAAMVKAQYGDDRERLSSRESLRAIMAQRTEPWVEVWARVAVGRSLLKESDAETRRLGVVELLHIPSRLEAVVPYLTGVAMAEAAAGLRRLGDLAGGSVIREELLRRYSGHPAVEWSMVRDWPQTAPQRVKEEVEAEELPRP